MIWLPQTTDNSTHFAQSLEIRGIESRLYMVADPDISIYSSANSNKSDVAWLLLHFDVICGTLLDK